MTDRSTDMPGRDRQPTWKPSTPDLPLSTLSKPMSVRRHYDG